MTSTEWHQFNLGLGTISVNYFDKGGSLQGGNGNVTTKLQSGNPDVSGFGGFTVTPGGDGSGKCCCPDETDGHIVYVQLRKDGGWIVDTDNVDDQRGGYWDDKGINRVRTYINIGGRSYEKGHIDTPGLDSSRDGSRISPRTDYSRDFRIESYCRCGDGDHYTGESQEFNFSRDGLRNYDGKISNRKQSKGDNNSNPSQYPGR